MPRHAPNNNARRASSHARPTTRLSPRRTAYSNAAKRKRNRISSLDLLGRLGIERTETAAPVCGRLWSSGSPPWAVRSHRRGRYNGPDDRRLRSRRRAHCGGSLGRKVKPVGSTAAACQSEAGAGRAESNSMSPRVQFTLRGMTAKAKKQHEEGMRKVRKWVTILLLVTGIAAASAGTSSAHGPILLKPGAPVLSAPVAPAPPPLRPLRPPGLKAQRRRQAQSRHRRLRRARRPADDASLSSSSASAHG